MSRPDQHDSVTNPSIAVGLNGLMDWSPAQPFLDHFKMARPWVGRKGDIFHAMSFDELRQAGAIDPFGWPLHVPSGIDAIGAVLLTELDPNADDLAGRYVMAWGGQGEISLLGAQNIQESPNRMDFTFQPDPGQHLEVRITRLGSQPIRNIRIVKADNVARYNNGNLFRIEWLDMIRNYRLLRFMDWMQTNDSVQSEWDSRARANDAFYTWRGAPVEVMVRLANAVGVDAWFNMPHLATPDYIERFSAYVRKYLNPGLKAYYEYSNEMWNTQFGQSLWAIDRAREIWPGQGDGFVQHYAGKSVEMAQILDRVYAGGNAALVKVISTHTHWLGLEDAILNAPEWRRDDPSRQPPHRYFNAYAVSGYFDGGLQQEENSTLIREICAMPSQRARTALRDQILHGGWPESGRTIAGLRQVWDYHADIARRLNLDLIMYEGGTHITLPDLFQTDDALMRLYESFNYSAEMGQIYQAALAEWRAAGGKLFNVFVECARPAHYGYWGLQRHIGDENPRWSAVEVHNREYPGDADRPDDAFLGSYERGGG